MKNIKHPQLSPHQNGVPPSPRESTLKILQPQANLRQFKPNRKSKRNPDLKASDIDHTHKLELSHAQIKDISYIETKPEIEDDPSPGHNLSGLSIINMLQESVLKSPVKEPDAENDNHLKQELEMKNRLVQTLMGENARLREEMETAMAKESPNASKQEDPSQKIGELEQQLETLKGDNKGLKEELQRKLESDTTKDAEIKKLEKQMEQYVKQSKQDMEEFHSSITQQMLSFMEKSRRQHKELSALFRKQTEEITTASSVQTESSSAGKTKDSLLSNFLKPHQLFKEKRNAKERGMNYSIPSLLLSTAQNSSSISQEKSFTKKKYYGAQTSRTHLSQCKMIDEKPEIGGDNVRSTPKKKASHIARNLRKMEGIENQNPNPTKKNGTRNSIKEYQGSKSFRNTGTPSGGASGCKKKPEKVN